VLGTPIGLAWKEPGVNRPRQRRLDGGGFAAILCFLISIAAKNHKVRAHFYQTSGKFYHFCGLGRETYPTLAQPCSTFTQCFEIVSSPWQDER
jgi:hypothetical protein